MRGRPSSVKARLRSAGYKCNVCGRRLIDAATLVRHQKTVHKVPPRDNKVGLKVKTPTKRPKLTAKEKDKIFDELLKDTPAETKPKAKIKLESPPETESPNKSEPIIQIASQNENGKQLLLHKDQIIKDKKVSFECPACLKRFNVYFNALKHIERKHCVNIKGEKVDSSSPDIIKPVRVEQCYRCGNQMRSNEVHVCPEDEEQINVIAEFICSACNHMFVSLRSFDVHVASMHSDASESMFFPTRLEFMTWRLEMERQTNSKYTLYGEYDPKKIYRCNYARSDNTLDKYTAYFCPSSIVVEEFKKGIQVHYYSKHYDHQAYSYMLSNKYKKYNITTILKDSIQELTKQPDYTPELEEAELLGQFKNLMDTIMINAADVNIPVLRKLIEKALDMSLLVTESGVPPAALTPIVTLSGKEIPEELEITTAPKRRKSADSSEAPKPAKRTRNKSLVNYNDKRMSPKILNTFSLATDSNKEHENGDAEGSATNTANKDTKDVQNKKVEPEKTNRSKINTRLSSFNESLSFNDSYKDFIDKNFIGKTKGAEKPKNAVKTKLGFRQTSPRNVDKQDLPYDVPLGKRIGIIPITPNKPKADVDTANTETAKIKILSDEKTNVTFSKVKVDTNEVPDSVNSKVNTSKVNTRSALSLIDPTQVKITKLKRKDSSPEMDSTRNASTKTRRGSTPLTDPLELKISKTKAKLEQKSINPRNTLLIDPLTVNTVKIVHKVDAPKVYTGPGSPKVSSLKPKVAKSKSEEKLGTKFVAVKEFKYEVREQENDCNILVLKLEN